MLLRLFLLFTVIPLIELILLIRIGQLLGLWPTIALVLLTGIVGASLAKWQGLRVYREIQREMQAGHMPASRLVDGAFIFTAGVLLITPGLLTDIVGFLLLAPPSRALLKQFIVDWFKRKVESGKIQVHVGPVGPNQSTSRPEGNPRPYDPRLGDRHPEPGDDDRDRE